jgi:hypothetical protein
MKINEITDNKRLDEIWPAVVAGAGVVAKNAPRIGRAVKNMFKKAPDSAAKKGITKGDSRAVINRKSSTEFDALPLSKKATGKVHTDPKLGNTERWRKDSNLDIQKMASDVRQGISK